MLKRALVLVGVVLLLFQRSPAFQYVLTLQNDTLVSSTAYEFDVYIQSLSGSLNLTSYQIFLTYNTAIAGAGALTFAYIDGSSGISTVPNVGVGIYDDEGTSKLGAGSSATASTITTSPVRLGRFRLSNTVPFGPQTANIGWNFGGSYGGTLVNINNTNATGGGTFNNVLANLPLVRYVLTLQNDELVSSTAYEFDVYIQSLSGSLNLTSYQIFLTYNTAIAGAGALTFAYIDGSSGISTVPNVGVGIYDDEGTSKLGAGSSATASTITTSPVRLGRFRLSNTVPFGPQTANIGWNFGGSYGGTLVNINNTNATGGGTFNNVLANLPLVRYVLTLQNDTLVSSTAYEFDVYIQSLSGSLNLTSYQIFLTYNTAIAGAGALTFAYIDGSSGISTVPNVGVGIYDDEGTSKLGAGSSATASTITTSPVRLGRFRLSNTVPFGPQTANIGWNFGGSYGGTLVNINNTNATGGGTYNNLLGNPPLPIQLASFTASVVRDNDVEVAWKTVSETNNYGFENLQETRREW